MILIIIITYKIYSSKREVNKKAAEEAELGYSYSLKSEKTGENVDTTIKFIVKEVLKKHSLSRSKNPSNFSRNDIKISKNKGENNCPS